MDAPLDSMRDVPMVLREGACGGSHTPCAKNTRVLADEGMYTTSIERWGSSFMVMVKLIVQIVVVDMRRPRFRCEGASV